MISRRTWSLFAATVIAFLAALIYWNWRPAPPDLSNLAVWDLDDFVGPKPYQEWFAVGVLCAIISSISVLADFIMRRRKRA
jgi:hypothetical protein